jgi:hypothetical protein
MQAGRSTHGAFRLLVRLADHDVVHGGRVYTSFREAQGCVAAAVRAARDAGGHAVLLQTAVRLLDTDDRPDPAFRPPLYAWVTMKHWDAAVIERILSQDATQPCRSHAEPSASRARTATCDPAARAPDPLHAAAEARHRPTRWDLVGAAAFALAAMVGLFLLQSGGRHAALASPPAADFDAPARCLEGLVYVADDAG